jgi:hypothetical protein
VEASGDTGTLERLGGTVLIMAIDEMMMDLIETWFPPGHAST